MDEMIEKVKEAILAIDASRQLPGYHEEGVVGSDLSDWEREVVARAAIAALAPPADEVLDALVERLTGPHYQIVAYREDIAAAADAIQALRVALAVEREGK